jgi:aminoglycoside phosphotransferase (APT) family kinase protein
MDWSTVSLEPLEGGFSGETFVAHTVDGDVVVRTYARDPERVGVDASLLRLVRGLLPVPAVLEVRLPVDGQPGVLVTEWLEGQPLDRLADDRAGDVDWTALGTALGRALRTLTGIPFLHSGVFAGPDLAAVSGSLPDDLTDWARTARATGRLSIWSDADWAGLENVVHQAATAIAAGPARAVLVHSDFNLKNLLGDPISWQLTGVVDWEFAHAGSPDADLGNVTRFERDPAFVSALVGALDDDRPAAGGNRLLRGRAADLWALIELAGRPQANTVSTLAERLLLAQARERDLNAWPFDATRVSVRDARRASADARIGSERGKPLF